MMGPKHSLGAAKLKIAGLAAALLVCAPGETLAQTPTEKEFFGQYCAACHNDRVRTGNFSLDQVDFSKFGSQPELGEKILRKLHTGTMPPPDMPQPSDRWTPPQRQT
jgi:mono/diheme cytochrome c family protein